MKKQFIGGIDGVSRTIQDRVRHNHTEDSTIRDPEWPLFIQCVSERLSITLTVGRVHHATKFCTWVKLIVAFSGAKIDVSFAMPVHPNP
jgi:hypothetical protein